MDEECSQLKVLHYCRHSQPYVTFPPPLLFSQIDLLTHSLSKRCQFFSRERFLLVNKAFVVSLSP